MDLSKKIGIREDYPKKGISFKDITPLIQDKDAFNEAVKQMIAPYKNKKVTSVLCADARGFIFGAAAAYALNCGLAIARKPNKLPYVDISETYNLEYGSATLEIPVNAVKKGDNILIVDDLLATGGSALALTKLAKRKDANIIGYSFLIELTGLKGKDLLEKDVPLISLIKYEF